MARKKKAGVLPVSKRVSASVESPLRKYLPFAEQAEREGVRVYYVNIGQPDLPAPASFFRGVRNFPERVVRYTKAQGYPETRKAWASFFRGNGISLSEEEILITTSGSEAFTFAFLAVCDPGDSLLVFEPFYSNYKSVARLLDIQLVPVETRVEDGFSLPPAKAIEKKIGARTRGIVVTNPCNPTGAVYPRKDIMRLVRIAERHGLWIIADETYRELVFHGRRATSFLDIPAARQRTILVDSVSKRFSLCGARIGCIATKNEDMRRQLVKLAQARLASPHVEQVAVVPVLQEWRPLLKRTRAEYRKRRDIVFRALQKMPGVVCARPEGALYIIARFPVDSAESFVTWMLQSFRYRNQTVMLTPAEDFYMTPGKGKQEMRIAYVLKGPQLQRAMDVLARGLLAYPGRTMV